MNEDDVKRKIESMNRPIFDKVLKEAGLGSMTPECSFIKILWRPNNYRRIMEIKSSKSLPDEMRGCSLSWSMKPSNKLIFVRDYMGVTLQVGRRTLTAIYSQEMKRGVKKTFCFKGEKLDDISDMLEEKKEEIKKIIDNALVSFARKFGLLKMNYKMKWSRYEDWIKGEEYIDKLPRDTIIYDTVFKKVYGEGIEFVKHGDEEPVTHVKNFIKNRALEDASQLAHEQLLMIREGFDRVMELLERQAECNLNTAEALSVVSKVLKGSVGKKEKVVEDSVGRPEYVG